MINCRIKLMNNKMVFIILLSSVCGVVAADECGVLSGCASCNQDHTCAECLSTLAYPNLDGNCQCVFPELQFDSQGECVKCRAPGCSICSSQQDQYDLLTCHLCLDPSIVPTSGKCTCQPHLIMINGVCTQCPVKVVDAKCQPCTLHGCAVCEDGETCDICVDSRWTLADGLCTCTNPVQVLNVDGICSICSVEGCRMCESDLYYSQHCHDCIDSSATIVEGLCVCEGGSLDANGFCVWCNDVCHVPACACCAQDNPNQCVKCIDQISGSLSEQGLCVCLYAGNTLDSQGYCVQCRVNGCEVCEHHGNSIETTCAQCLYSNSTLSDDGKCLCDDPHVMLNGVCSECPTPLISGNCQPCAILGCAVCPDGQTCQLCTHPSSWAAIYQGNCLCTNYGDVFDRQGICFPCWVEGCAMCEEQQYQTCSECLDPHATLSNGLCQCDGGVMNDGYCTFCNSECNVYGCICCEEEDENRCSICNDRQWAEIDENGVCHCPYSDVKINSYGFCDACSVDGCASCHAGSSSSCFICEDKYILEEGACNECPPREYVEDGECKSCSDGCILCQSVELCFECEEGKVVENDECVECPPETFPFEGKCLACEAENCQSCASPTICAVCSAGAVFVSLGFCELCPVGFASVDHQCESCQVEGCKHCAEVGICDECIDDQASLVNERTKCECDGDMVLTSSGYCFLPPQHPSDSTDPGIFSLDGTPAECSAGCSSCSSLTTCTSCLSNFFKEAGHCTHCHSSCLTCKGSTSDDCISCPVGFYLREGRCQQCSHNQCLKCSAPDQCDSCVDNFVAQDGQCVTCGSNCVTCSSSTQCMECELGFTVISSGCEECLSSCGKCSPHNITQCEGCGIGKFLSDAQCKECGDNCVSCESQTLCSECSVGFAPKDGVCQRRCNRPCIQCQFDDEEQMCSKCLAGYILDGHSCSPDLSCNSQENCEVCPMGSVLIHHLCQPCTVSDIHCTRCSPTDLKLCLTCKKGFFLQGGVCSDCGPTCDDCQSDNFCLTCTHRYFNVQLDGVPTGKCLFCQRPCFTCQDQASRCTSCIEGYSNEGWKCVSDIQVSFQLIFDANLPSFLPQAPEFRNYLKKLIKQELSSSSVTINVLARGSVRAEGSFQAESSEQGQAIYQDLSAGLKEGSSMMGYSIVESNVTKHNMENQEEPEQGEEKINMGGIIGGIIAACVSVIAIILIIVFKVKSSKSVRKEEEIEEKNASGNVIFSQNI